jgi:hypothetical protein
MLNVSSLHIDLHLNEAKDVTYTRTPFGKEMRKLFTFDPQYRNLNHGKCSLIVSNGAEDS